MGSILVAYKTKYGTTKTYAEWIAEETGADLIEAKHVTLERLLNYDTIVYCGALYAGGMLGFSRIRKQYAALKGKRLIVVAVGATTQKEKALEEVRNGNFMPEMKDVPLFVLRGGIDYKKMGIVDRVLMFLLVSSIRRKGLETLDADSKGLLASYNKTVSFVNRRHIAPVVEAIRTE